MKNYKFLLFLIFGASFILQASYVNQTDVNQTEKSSKNSNPKPFKCLFEGCSAAFTVSSSLTVHTRTHTGDCPFKCTVEGCSAAFTVSSSLTVHTRTHTGEKPFLCTFEGCGAAFAQSGTLRRHQRTQHDVTIQQLVVPSKPPAVISSLNICEVCSKFFATKYTLKTHEKIHTGEKPFKCTIEDCDAAFAQRAHLTVHTRTHMGERPFTCTFEGCGASFFRSDALTGHIRTHTGEKIACTFPGCSAAFIRSCALKKHEREKHNLLELMPSFDFSMEGLFADQFD